MHTFDTWNIFASTITSKKHFTPNLFFECISYKSSTLTRDIWCLPSMLTAELCIHVAILLLNMRMCKISKSQELCNSLYVATMCPWAFQQVIMCSRICTKNIPHADLLTVRAHLTLIFCQSPCQCALEDIM